MEQLCRCNVADQCKGLCSHKGWHRHHDEDGCNAPCVMTTGRIKCFTAEQMEEEKVLRKAW